MRLTGSGIGVLTGSAVLFGLSWWTGIREIGLVAFTGILLVLAALLCVLPRLTGPVIGPVTAERTIRPGKVGRGQHAEGLLTVIGTGHLQAFEVYDGVALPIPLPALKKGVTEVVQYPIPTLRRGPHTVGPLRLVRVDPLGLARRTVHIGSPQTLLVRPRTMELIVFPSGRQHHPDGATSDSFVGSAGSFHSLREFVVGDDTRRIHWPSTARTGRVMVRQVADITMPSVTVVLDTRASAYPHDDAFEVGVEAAASIALAATKRGYRVMLHLGADGVLTTGGQHRDAGILLDRLSYVERSETASLPKGRKRTDLSVVITGPGAQTADEAGVLILRTADTLEEMIGRLR